MDRDNIPSAVSGCGALMSMLNVIGNGVGDCDSKVAKILVSHEIPLRDLVKYALEKIAEDN